MSLCVILMLLLLTAGPSYSNDNRTFEKLIVQINRHSFTSMKLSVLHVCLPVNVTASLYSQRLKILEVILAIIIEQIKYLKISYESIAV